MEKIIINQHRSGFSIDSRYLKTNGVAKSNLWTFFFYRSFSRNGMYNPRFYLQQKSHSNIQIFNSFLNGSLSLRFWNNVLRYQRSQYANHPWKCTSFHLPPSSKHEKKFWGLKCNCWRAISKQAFIQCMVYFSKPNQRSNERSLLG